MKTFPLTDELNILIKVVVLILTKGAVLSVKPAKVVVSDAFRAWKAGRNFDLDGQGSLQRDAQVGCCVFVSLCHRTHKISSSLNKPVPGSKIMEKRSEKKSAGFESRLTSDLHQLSFSCPLFLHAKRNTAKRVR